MADAWHSSSVSKAKSLGGNPRTPLGELTLDTERLHCRHASSMEQSAWLTVPTLIIGTIQRTFENTFIYTSVCTPGLQSSRSSWCCLQQYISYLNHITLQCSASWDPLVGGERLSDPSPRTWHHLPAFWALLNQWNEEIKSCSPY